MNTREIPISAAERAVMEQSKSFETKDSGERVNFPSGMRRDIQEGKPRYDLIPLQPLRRLAELYARGAEKYGERNWQLSNSPEELQRFKASAWRHFVQFMNNELDEDHGIAVVWNIFAILDFEDRQELDLEFAIRDVTNTEQEVAKVVPNPDPQPQARKSKRSAKNGV